MHDVSYGLRLATPIALRGGPCASFDGCGANVKKRTMQGVCAWKAVRLVDLRS